MLTIFIEKINNSDINNILKQLKSLSMINYVMFLAIGYGVSIIAKTLTIQEKRIEELEKSKSKGE